MVEFLKTLAIACIPAIITGIVTYIVARKNAASQISIIKEQNKHDLEKLMEQHKVDIEHLKEAHRLDMLKIEFSRPPIIGRAAFCVLIEKLRYFSKTPCQTAPLIQSK